MRIKHFLHVNGWVVMIQSSGHQDHPTCTLRTDFAGRNIWISYARHIWNFRATRNYKILRLEIFGQKWTADRKVELVMVGKRSLSWKRFVIHRTAVTMLQITATGAHELVYGQHSIIFLPKQERRQWADWNKSVHVETCLEVSHMRPQLSAILSEWQHVKWNCVWALSRCAAPSWQRASAHVSKISSCHSAMWVPTAKTPTLQDRPSSLGLFSIPSYDKISSG